MNKPVTTKLILIAQITIDAGTQVRAAINEDVVAQYADAIDAGDTFPNVVTYHDGAKWFLADGFHRLLAVKRLDHETIRCEVHQGTRADALKYALSANYSHGLPRTNADKRKSAQIALTEWPKLSNRELARICAVSDMFIATVRKQLQGDCSSLHPETRIGADGKERKMPKKQSPKPATGKASDSKEETGGSSIQEATITPSKDADFREALGVGVSGARNWFASQVEDIAGAIIDDASDEQLAAAISQWEVELRKLRAAQKQRKAV